MRTVTLEDCRDDLVAAFARRAESAGTVDRHFCVAGVPITIRFAGDELVEFLSSAYDHLPRHDGTDPDALVVHCWAADTDAPLPRLPRAAFPQTPEEERDRLGADIVASYDWGTRTLEVHDIAACAAWNCTIDVAELQWWLRAAPVKMVIARHLERRGVHLVHSAGVARDGAAVLLTGPSGSGKSTTSLRCLVAGLDFLGDDYVVGTPDLRVHSILGSAKAHLHNLEGFSDLVDDASPTQGGLPDEKMIMWPARTWPERVTESADIVGVVALRVSSAAESTVESVSPATALRALAPSTVIQLPGIGERSLAHMAAITAAVPCWSLSVGSDHAGVVDAVSELIDRGRT